MEEVIEILSEKITNSIDSYSLADRAYILKEIATRLQASAQECLLGEYREDSMYNDEN